MIGARRLRQEQFTSNKMSKNQTQLQQIPKAELETALHTPSVILVGPSIRVNEVAAEINSLGMQVIKANYVKQMKEAITDRVVAVIYVMPLKRSHVLSVHKNVKKQAKLKKLNFFAIAPEWVSARTEREMYKVGIRMIFDWSREKSSFKDLFGQALSQGLEKVASSDADISLKRAIENRLSAVYGGFTPKVQITVYHGIALLKGSVRSISFRRDLVKTVKRTPGLRGVVDQSLRVEGGKQLRRDLQEKANKVLRETYGIDHKTLEVSYDQKVNKLTLVGTVDSKKDGELAIHRLEQLHGVGEVLNRVTVSKKTHKKDNFLARRAQRVVKKMRLADGSKVRVKVREGKALLRGEVKNRIEASHLASEIEKIDGIKSVDNMMAIANR